MKIYNINPINFTAKKTIVTKKDLKPAEKFTKENFYNQIDGFMNNQIDKEKYFKMFSDGVDKIYKQQDILKYNPIERKYINNLVSLLDMSENHGSIPEQYLKKNMELLLAHKK